MSVLFFSFSRRILTLIFVRHNVFLLRCAVEQGDFSRRNAVCELRRYAENFESTRYERVCAKTAHTTFYSFFRSFLFFCWFSSCFNSAPELKKRKVSSNAKRFVASCLELDAVKIVLRINRCPFISSFGKEEEEEKKYHLIWTRRVQSKRPASTALLSHAWLTSAAPASQLAPLVVQSKSGDKGGGGGCTVV